MVDSTFNVNPENNSIGVGDDINIFSGSRMFSM